MPLRFLRRAALALASLAVVLFAVCLVRMATIASRQPSPPPAETVALDEASLASHLGGALRFETISSQEPGQTRADQLAALQRYLEETYPRAHAALSREPIAVHSLLYTWKGTEPALAPLLLLAHQDVVPVEPATLGKWTHPPFAGVVEGGYVWGRGAIDNKGTLIALLEAIEGLTAAGFVPRRTVLLAFGHDEEIGGAGAIEIARTLEARGVTAELVLDEGQAILEGIVPGLTRPVAFVGVAEKGYLSLELTAESEGGHSSRPPANTTVGLLSRAIARLEASPFPARLDGPARSAIVWLAPEYEGFVQRLAGANLWLLSKVVSRQLLKLDGTAALLRTTTAATMFEAGVKENVLPMRARAVVNLRLRPGDSIASATARVREVIGDGAVKVAALQATQAEPSPISPEDEVFHALAATIRQIDPEAVVAPSLVLGASDARHYAGVSRHIYRFAANRLSPDDLRRIHSLDERISVKNLVRQVRFYRQLILNRATR